MSYKTQHASSNNTRSLTEVVTHPCAFIPDIGRLLFFMLHMKTHVQHVWYIMFVQVMEYFVWCSVIYCQTLKGDTAVLPPVRNPLFLQKGPWKTLS